jgi:hypothetical protein
MEGETRFRKPMKIRQEFDNGVCGTEKVWITGAVNGYGGRGGAVEMDARGG